MPDNHAVALSDQLRQFHLFAQAILGTAVHIESITNDDQSSTRPWQREPLTEGWPSIELPSHSDLFNTASDNRRALRCALLHQLNLISYGSYSVALLTARRRLYWPEADWSAHTAQTPRKPQPVSQHALTRLFAMHEHPLIFQRVFACVEGWRVDLKTVRDYPGARTDLAQTMDMTRSLREQQWPRPIQASVESLLRLTLSLSAPPQAHPLSAALMAVADASADVYTSLQASLQICRLLSDQSGVLLPTGTAPALVQDEPGDSASDPGNLALTYRGDAFSADAMSHQTGAGQMLASEATGWGSSDEADQATASAASPAATEVTPAADEPQAPDTTVHFIDEWDYLGQCWRTNWCRLFQHPLIGDHYESINQRLRALQPELAQIKQQFRSMRAASLRRQRALPDGHDIDLDAVITAVADRRAGYHGHQRLYETREPAERDVAVAFLIDMSASTDFPIEQVIGADANDPDEPTNDENPGAIGQDSFLYGVQTNEPPDPLSSDQSKSRRVIDVARESVALMAIALDELGDQIGIYGFSGQGRHRVTYAVVKDFGQPFSSATLAALGAVEPQGSTRMGAAIRHTSRLLARAGARQQLLMIISDGYPQDLDYGPRHDSDEYGLQDTAQALSDARAQGISPYCVTVDPAGYDYLKRMCPDGQYMVINEVDGLPRALASIYQSLTGSGQASQDFSRAGRSRRRAR